MKQKYTCDYNYFKTVDTEEKAYWLGFLMADGCVHNKRLSLELQEKDLSHLKLFKDNISSTHPITYLKPREKFPGSYSNPAYRFRISSPILANDLDKQGMHPNKTFTACFPNLQTNLVNHFIRGLLDGDGCVHLNKDKNSKFVYFLGTENIIINIIKHIGIDKNYQPYGKIYRVKYGSLNHIKYLYEYLYNNSTVFLKRKRDIVEEIIK